MSWTARWHSARGAGALRRLWAVAIAALFLHLSIHAIGPLARTWDLEDSSQAGQLTIYNNLPMGGRNGMPIEIGDWDGDGHQDLAVAPMNAGGRPAAPRPEAGAVHVYKGDGAIAGVLDRDATTPPSITFWGARAGDLVGTELYTADLNGDGAEDLIIGSQNHDGPGGDCTNCGAVYVLFGHPELFAAAARDIDLAEPPPDVSAHLLIVHGGEPGGRLGVWVEAGDLDGDGLDDLVLGADQAPADHRGTVVVIYGRRTFPAEMRLDAGAPAEIEDLSFVLGRDPEDHFGCSIHCVDLNGDGADELIVGSALNRLSAGVGAEGGFEQHSSLVGGDGPDGLRRDAGEATVIFSRGAGRLPALLDVGAPPEALRSRITFIYGSASGEYCGEEITSGDFDGDGDNDLVLGAITADSPTGVARAGRAYVLYSEPGLEGVEIDLALAVDGRVPPGAAVSMMHGLEALDILGDTLSAADFNHDGIDDLAVGIPHALARDRFRAGMVAVVYGRPTPWPALWAPQADELPRQLEVAYILGAEAHDLLSYSMEARDYDSDGYADLFANAMTGDGRENRHESAGEAYVVSGYHFGGTTLSVSRARPATGHVSTPTQIQLTGQGFTRAADMTVRVGGRDADTFTVVNGRRIDLTVPAAGTPGPADITVTTRYGTATLQAGFRYLPEGEFVRGDANLDLVVTIADAVRILAALFEGTAPLRCLDAADTNDDGGVDISDVIYLLDYLFQGGLPPPPPSAALGPDPTVDPLTCAAGP